ncbi:hypothetical protein FRB91_005144 [Serendipita sp. 411]|nr:hypothetical protein FRB91_005144 [Serendipita sp. 411]
MSSGIKNRFSILFQKRQQAAPVRMLYFKTTQGSAPKNIRLLAAGTTQLAKYHCYTES